MADTKQKMIKDKMTEAIVETVHTMATETGAEKINVRMVLSKMNISNRVFYNRFANIDEVLDAVYERIAMKIRESIAGGFDPDGDYFAEVKNIAVNTLIMSYEQKRMFNSYSFNTDSFSGRNFEWWKAEIEKLIDFGKDRGFLKNVDTERMSYAVWCFIRGYNADAVARGIPRDVAAENFRYSFGVFLDGMKK